MCHKQLETNVTLRSSCKIRNCPINRTLRSHSGCQEGAEMWAARKQLHLHQHGNVIWHAVSMSWICFSLYWKSFHSDCTLKKIFFKGIKWIEKLKHEALKTKSPDCWAHPGLASPSDTGDAAPAGQALWEGCSERAWGKGASAWPVIRGLSPTYHWFHQWGPHLPILSTYATHISMFKDKLSHQSLYISFYNNFRCPTISFS